MEHVGGTELDDLVRMVNQIAANHSHLAEVDAARAVANHVRLFWTSSMQHDLLSAVESGEVQLSPVAQQAMESLQPA